MAAALGRGGATGSPFLTALDDALYTRWPSAARTGYVPSDEDAEDAEDPAQREERAFEDDA